MVFDWEEVVQLFGVAALAVGLLEWRFKIIAKATESTLKELRDCIQRLEERIDKHLDKPGGER